MVLQITEAKEILSIEYVSVVGLLLCYSGCFTLVYKASIKRKQRKRQCNNGLYGKILYNFY